MKPFELKGAVSERQMIYDLIVQIAPGELVTYKQFEKALGRDLRDSRTPLFHAIKDLEINEQRTMEVVRGKGYRVVEPREHERLARHHQYKGRRQLTYSLRKARSAPREKLTPDEASRLDELEQRLVAQEQMLKRISERTKVVEQRQAQQEAEGRTVVQQVDRLTAAMKRRGLLED